MMMPYVMYYTSMLCKGCYPNSMVLSYSCGRAKYIRICYVWRVYFFESGGKNSPFSRISGYILAGTNVTIALHLIKPENVRRAMKKGKKKCYEIWYSNFLVHCSLSFNSSSKYWR